MADKTTLVIGDPHSSPKFNNDRFDALGNFIADKQPDNIVQLGDFLSLDSISTHDKNKPLLMEGRRLADDIEHGIDAYNRMMNPSRTVNDKLRSNRKKLYTPTGYWFLGNHEERSLRYVQANPALAGFVKYDSMVGAETEGWTVLPYQKYAYIDGVAFTHVPMNKRNNQSITGEHVDKTAVELASSSIIFGHFHRLMMHPISRNAEGKVNNVMFGVCAGWFGDYVPLYVEGNEGALDWWSGVLLLHHTSFGKFDIETISMDTLKAGSW